MNLQTKSLDNLKTFYGNSLTNLTSILNFSESPSQDCSIYFDDLIALTESGEEPKIKQIQ